ncbi:MAG: hypothetical protein GX783_07875 [Clostridiales bacterium]|nr:hypothetical protein [Clostridiales bacterium]
MNWKEIREIYPDQFVKFKVLKSHIKEDREYVDEIAFIGPVNDDEATKELLHAGNNELVYHTSKEDIVVLLRTRIGLRRLFGNAN